MSGDSSIFDDGDSPAKDDDSAIIEDSQMADPSAAAAAEGILRVYSVGEPTVVGFGGEDVPDEACIAGYRDQLDALTTEHNTKTLACDLSGVRFVPSGMLGVLISMRKKGLNIELYNPSEDVMEVLRITKLITLFTIKEVQL